VLVAIDVMHYFSTLKRSANHLLSYNAMLMPPMALAVGRFFYSIKSRKLSCAVTGSALLFGGNVVRVAVATHSLRVHSAHGVAVHWLVAAFNFAGARHCPTVAGNGIIPFSAASRQHR
jgi:hypothetical protein